MNNQKLLINLLVILALFGFIASSVFMFFKSFDLLVNNILPNDYLKNINSSLTYISSGLTGLVGGIVATAFGVKQNNNHIPHPVPKDNFKLQSLGNLISSSRDNVKSNKGKYGFLYALSYILIGVTSIIIWIYLGDNTIQPVSNMATTFFGMMIPIVAAYFNNN